MGVFSCESVGSLRMLTFAGWVVVFLERENIIKMKFSEFSKRHSRAEHQNLANSMKASEVSRLDFAMIFD